MTFKVKGGIQIGANSAVDSDALFQLIEAAPATRPTLLLDFARSKTIDSRLSFTRSSNASFIAQDGLIRYASVNQPRIEYDPNTGVCKGLLIEAARYNEQRYSEGFANNSYWSKSNLRVSENVAVAPDGSFTASRLYDSVDAAASYHSLASGSGFSIAASTVYTQSIYAKAGELSQIGIYPINSSNGAWFNISTGTIRSTDTGITATIDPYPNGWYRLTATVTSNAAATTAFPSLYTITPIGTSYTGNNDTLFVWGHQFENIGFATSYNPSIPTFTSRSSNATYYNSNGILQVATTDVARMSYTPSNLSVAPKLLLEQSSTNILTYSEQLDHVNWGKGPGDTVTANTTSSPDGTATADTYTKSAAAGYSFIRQGQAGLGANTTYTISCFVKKNNYRYVGLRAAGGTLPSGVDGGRHATFDFDTESFSAVPADYKTGFQKLPNGWYRIFATINLTVASTAAGWQLGISIPDSTGAEYWDSTSAGIKSVYAWGMQAETGFLTSYIPTTSASTRAADVQSISGSALRNNDVVTMPISTANLTTAEGTMYLEGQCDGEINSNQYLFDFGDSTVNSLTAIRSISSRLDFVVYNSGSGQGSLTLLDPYVANSVFKVAVAYSNTGWVGSSNGVLTTNAGPGYGVAKYGQLTIGSGYSGASTARRFIVRSASYYPVKLSNTEIQVLTAP